MHVIHCRHMRCVRWVTATSRETGLLGLTGSRYVKKHPSYITKRYECTNATFRRVQEHVATNFLSAWSTPIPGVGDGFVTDAAIRVVALSRWNNYYVEGVQQMMRDFALDG